MTVYLEYFVHSTTLDNERGIASGWLNGELSGLGVRQTSELRDLIAERKYDCVFSSDLRRAAKTAELVFFDRSPVRLDWRLRECNYGTLNGCESNVIDACQDPIVDGFPEGESYLDVELRMRSFLADMKRNFSGASIAVVSHRAPQLALDVLLGDTDWESAIRNDWRRTGEWSPGWRYSL